MSDEHHGSWGGDLVAGDLAGTTPGRVAPNLRERRAAREARKNARQRERLGRACPGPPDTPPLAPAGRPAPPEAVAAWVAHHAAGPGRPGDESYVTGGGAGFRRSFAEARAKFFLGGGCRAALFAAADHVDWELLALLRCLVTSGDVTGLEAYRLHVKRMGSPDSLPTPSERALAAGALGLDPADLVGELADP